MAETYLGPLCKRKHNTGKGFTQRYVSTHQCVKCLQAWVKSYNQKPERVAANRKFARAYYAANRDKCLRKSSAYFKTENGKQAIARSRKKNRSKLYAAARAWRLKNKKRISKYNAAYARSNVVRLKTWGAAYRSSNVETIRNNAKRYRARNTERINAAQHAYRDTTRGKRTRAIAQRRRNARKRAVLCVPYTDKEMCQLFRKFGWRCAYCGTRSALTVDHVQPISKGGVDTMRNIVPACKSCNTRKRTRHWFAWFKTTPHFTIARVARISKHLRVT